MQIPSSQLNYELSSVFGGTAYPASDCNDANLYDFCHTCDCGTDGDGAKLTITSPIPVDQVVVYNRYDCCQYRIVGATITLIQGGVQKWQDSFAIEDRSYSFPSECR